MNNPNSPKGDILIVDDVPENLQLLFSMLTERDYEVRRVLSGKQALQVVDMEAPDLILLDIKMPELDGYEVCKILKAQEKTKHIPIIFLSALNDTFDKVRAFDVGGVDYITKPFQIEEVVIRVENQLRLLKMQKEIEFKNKELILLNQDLEAFSHRVSHDLKNKIHIINGFTELITQEFSDQLDSHCKDYFRYIYDEGKRMAEVIQDLLRLSQVQNTELEYSTFNISELVTEISDKLIKENKDSIVDFVITPNIYCWGDLNLMRIVLENLLENACKYTSKTEKPRIEFGTFRKEGKNILFIKDNGVGFDSAMAEKLFTPFHRLHSEKEFKGTGIGLSTVKRIIQRHQGDIWYEAKINQGATFYFYLSEYRHNGVRI
ncbi:response regulator receiver sensor signal transduction histidine kinase [Cyanobacterium stanieri PCC 7202]|uniref:histidine kinase n=1 Tax=Cyanobacterium stanieri (strain ATCC 29140 / PCC 7202) TaxID=292563 RepID=K9YJC6_CYASC|nr:response regulator receiver sensor signal transduction histidine kinase [Cyanobacterium stanieri PCC 7202]